MDEKICEIRNGQICEQLKNHEQRIEELEKTYIIMQKMDVRMENVEDSIKRIDKKITEKTEEKGKKWDKLIDYLFYAILAGLLAYISHQLGLQ